MSAFRLESSCLDFFVKHLDPADGFSLAGISFVPIPYGMGATAVSRATQSGS
jgi:hypothetical protein